MIWLHLFMWLGHVGDMTSTHYALLSGCQEMNPIYYVVGFWGLVALKILALAYVSRVAYRRQAPSLLWIGLGAGWMLTGWNSMLIWLGVC